MLKVRITEKGTPTTYNGPDYRALLVTGIRERAREGTTLPLTVVETRRLSLTELVRRDAEWSAAHREPDYRVELVEE